jgi:hypothetical protein
MDAVERHAIHEATLLGLGKVAVASSRLEAIAADLYAAPLESEFAVLVASAAGESDPRLPPPRHHHPVRRAGARHRQGHRRLPTGAQQRRVAPRWEPRSLVIPHRYQQPSALLASVAPTPTRAPFRRCVATPKPTPGGAAFTCRHRAAQRRAHLRLRLLDGAG